MFDKILIANRGEIAVRIARTARRLGVASVAVYSDVDHAAPHVTACDEAVAIGGAAAADSYLVMERIIAAAQRTGAQGVHPGYGFLSENAAFADALEAAGLVFIGPTPDTIRAMGSKSAAKDLMQAAGVPVTPGYQGADQTLSVFQDACADIGYPVLLKAAAGGGGKGMRLVEREADLKTALAAAKREAASAFGDDQILVEKYIARARHLEVQVFGDGAGNVVHLFERDCSVQRRHQKIMEEAPAPNLAPDVRVQLLQAGVDAAKAVRYRGAGTVEFLYDGADGVYFMEMNTRLQVEHPVTEMITGLDLVEWQLRIAAGEGLPLAQDAITAHGHAFEARLYAENPDQDFAPSTGVLSTLRLPEESVRIDSGVAEGQSITPHYDPMIAKIITHGSTRAGALGQLRAALAHTRVAGVETNARFLAALAHDGDFAAGQVSTRYIAEHGDSLFARRPAEMRVWAAAALHARQAAQKAVAPTDAWRGFRLNAPSEELYWIVIDDAPALLRLQPSDGAERFTLLVERNASAAHRRTAGADYTPEPVENATFTATPLGDGGWRLSVDGVEASVFTAPTQDGQAIRIWIGAEQWDVVIPDVLSGAGGSTTDERGLIARLPGVVTLAPVPAGQEVKAGDTLMVLEAMKMEHVISAPADGVLARLHFTAGDAVKEGDVLMDFEATP